MIAEQHAFVNTAEELARISALVEAFDAAYWSLPAGPEQTAACVACQQARDARAELLAAMGNPEYQRWVTIKAEARRAMEAGV